jgi:hypothetical protein
MNQIDAVGGAGLSQSFAELPEEFCYSYYISTHPDLAALSEESAKAHFHNYGQSEGRAGSPYSSPQKFITLVNRDLPTLEIGPFCNPVVRGPNVKYFDVLDRASLIQRAMELDYPCSDPPDIEYVSATGDLGIVPYVFAQIVCSHCIEHQPDLVRHLQKCSALLTSRGRYFLIIPDKRFCFDHFIPVSNIADVVGAFCERRIVHSAVDVLENQSMTTHNDPKRHWRGDHGLQHWRTEDGLGRLLRTKAEFEQTEGRYHDTHAWQFTPDSFRDLLRDLKRLSLIDLDVVRVFRTLRDGVEFCAVLEKPSSLESGPAAPPNEAHCVEVLIKSRSPKF